MKVRFSLRKKVIIAILFIVVMLTIVIVTVSYQVYSNTMDEHYRTQTMHVAKTAANTIESEVIKKYVDGVKDIYFENPSPEFSTDSEYEEYLAQYDGIKDEGYEEIYSLLEKIKMSNEVLSLYVVYMDKETKTCVYIVDADNTETACPAGTWDIIYEKNWDALENPENGFPAYITKTDEFGWLCSAGSVIMDENGEVIAHAMVDISMDQVMNDRHMYLLQLVAIMVVVTSILVALSVIVVNYVLVKPINDLANAAASYVADKEDGHKEGGDNTLQKLSIHTGDEIENLCGVLKQMGQDINNYIVNLTKVTAEKERIGAELSVATQIQADMLPSIFPAFPGRMEFDIYASMTPAKEVGGDFYDFFLVDGNHLAMVMADVSGKGVPAALFMVIAKTLIKNRVLMGGTPKEVLEFVNNQLCENNKAEMFVTVWLGIMEISTGKVIAANAGHEYPAIKKADGSFELLKDRHGFVLAGMEDTKYGDYEFEIRNGDYLYVYTDGVAEATNSSNELFGTERMLGALNKEKDADPETILKNVKQDIDSFVVEAPQFDDITMLCLKYYGEGRREKNFTKKIMIEAEVSKLKEVLDFINEQLEAKECSMKAQTQIDIVVEELFVNIAYYAYTPNVGTVEIQCEFEEGDTEVIITLKDQGIPYNPLEKEDPDITLSAQERQIGGLGIYMVKKSVDDMAYEYKDKQNIVSVRKKIK